MTPQTHRWQDELETLVRARYPILYVISNEEMRAQQVVLEIARKRQKKVFEWTCTDGIALAGTSIQAQKSRNAATRDPLIALDQVIEQSANQDVKNAAAEARGALNLPADEAKTLIVKQSRV